MAIIQYMTCRAGRRDLAGSGYRPPVACDYSDVTDISKVRH